MANKKLTEEQQSQIKILLQSNEMLERTKKEAQDRGQKGSVKQIERAQQDVIEQLNSIDPTALETSKKQKRKEKQSSLFGDLDVSMFGSYDETDNKAIDNSPSMTVSEAEAGKDNIVSMTTQSDTVIMEDTMYNDVDPMAQYDVIQLPSNGQCYKNKMDRVPVAFLTAYDENIITSPNLYKDGLVIDFLLKNKIVNKDINPDDLVSGDVDAIILFLRATSYGADFPIIVADPETGEQIETTVDLTTLKPKEFTLVGDENGWFDYETPLRKDKIKFRYLTRKQEKQLQKLAEIENYGTKAFMLETEKDILNAAMRNDKYISDADKKVVKNAIGILENWAKKLKEVSNTEYNKIITNSMILQIMSVNGNTDREYIAKYVNSMPARDSLMLRRYINDNKPGINFDIEVQRPESLGGGSFKTFLNWDDSIFLNIADI